MAMRRRRRGTVRVGRKGAGRQKIWIHSTAANIALQEVTTGTFSDLIIEPVQWERESLATTTPSKDARGGARLEGLYLDVGISLADADTQFPPVWAELMVYTQSSQFLNFVTSSTAYDQVFAGQRILLYDFGSFRSEYINTSLSLRRCHFSHKFKISSKVALNQMAVGIAVRLTQDLTGFDSSGVVIGYRALVTLP